MCWPEAIFSRQWRLVESWFHRLCHSVCEELHPRTGLQSFIGFAAALGLSNAEAEGNVMAVMGGKQKVR